MRFCKRAALAAATAVGPLGGAFAQPQASGNAFNPAISLILDGHYSSYTADPARYELPGFALGENGALPTEGLSLDETELAISANVDDKYYGFVAASLEQDADDTSVELEEAYFETLALAHGLKVKAGRFRSEIGYLNPIHPHAWDFFDTPLAYAAMLDSGYADTGVQVSWVVPAEFFLQVGAEWLRGDAFPAANGAASGGTGAATVFFHVGGDVGATSSWRAGVSYLSADANDRLSTFAAGSSELSFTGNSDVAIADFVWKWARNGNPADRYYVLQAEYMHRKEDGSIGVGGPFTAPVEATYSGTQSGFYVQGVYQFRPRWRAGLRYDRLDASNAVSAAVPTPLASARAPTRVTAMADFSNSEFSRMRLQIARDESRAETDDQIIFQYLMSLGAHGAHRF